MTERHIDITQLVEPAETCLCFNLRKSARAVTQLYDEALRPSGLRITQFTMLVALRLLGSVTVNRMAEELVMDRTTLTRNLRPLKREGLIRIVPGKDRREREVILTTAGQEALGRAFPLWKEAQAKVAGHLGRERTSRLLKDLAAAVEMSQAG